MTFFIQAVIRQTVSLLPYGLLLGSLPSVTATVQRINGSSMAPTLSPDYHETGQCDYVLFKRLSGFASQIREWQRGEVVLFWSPIHGPEKEVKAVKRIIAVAGDVVVLDRRRIKGRKRGIGNMNRGRRGSKELEQDEDESIVWRTAQKSFGLNNKDDGERRVTVPYGHVWVEGDNRYSGDSNDYGPISKNLIIGRAVWIILPFTRWGSMDWEAYRSKTKIIPGKIEEEEAWVAF